MLVATGITIPLIIFLRPTILNTQELGQIDTGGYAFKLDVVGDIAYVIDVADYTPGGMVIINVSDPTNPRVLGSYFDSGMLRKVDVKDGIAYIANYQGGLEVVNVTDPSNPTRIYHYASSQTLMDVQVEGNFAYVADWNRGLIILDISDPANIVEEGQYMIGGACVHVKVEGNRAYIMDHHNDYSGIAIVDISDPSNPSFLGAYAPSGVDLWNPVVRGDYMYVGDHSGGTNQFFILDVSDPSQIQEAGRYTSRGMTSFFIDGNFLYSANWDKGLEIYDITDPIDPNKLGGFYDGGEAYDVMVVSNIAYVADAEDGLEIIEIQL